MQSFRQLFVIMTVCSKKDCQIPIANTLSAVIICLPSDRLPIYIHPCPRIYLQVLEVQRAFTLAMCPKHSMKGRRPRMVFRLNNILPLIDEHLWLVQDPGQNVVIAIVNDQSNHSGLGAGKRQFRAPDGGCGAPARRELATGQRGEVSPAGEQRHGRVLGQFTGHAADALRQPGV